MKKPAAMDLEKKMSSGKGSRANDIWTSSRAFLVAICEEVCHRDTETIERSTEKSSTAEPFAAVSCVGR
jgi:hypothetical protein